MDSTAILADGAKCARCWKRDTAVGRNYDWPDLCARCADVLNELRADDPTHSEWGVNGSLEQTHATHPIRALARDPTVTKLVLIDGKKIGTKDHTVGKIIEVWGSAEQMPWRFAAE